MNKQIDVVVDAQGMPQAPIDPSVTIPASVRAASKAADAIHAQAYAPPDGAEQPSTPNPVEPSTPKPIEPPAPSAPVTATVRPDPNAPKGSPEFEAHTEASMKGRWEASQRQLGIAQQQLQEMGRELVQTQALLQRTAPLTQPVAPTAQKRLTDKDVETYGDDLISVVQRAAEDAISPQLTRLEQENQQLRRGLQQTRQQTAQQTVHAALATWRADWEMINNDPKFHDWLRLPDLYSGRVRQQMLKEAFDGGNASRVLAFFQGFIQDGLATGSIEPPQPQPGAGNPPPPSRAAAVPLDSLTAPGKAKPASGGSATTPADKPVITHKYIKDFYTLSRRGAFVGREAEKERLENEIFSAQREGRVR